MKDKIRVAVLFGGVSTEHEVSLASAYNVLKAIDRDKYEVVEIGMTKSGRFVYGERSLYYLMQEGQKELLPTSVLPLREETKALDYSAYRPVGAASSKNEICVLGGSSAVGHHSEKGFSFADVDVLFPVMHGAMGEDGAIQGLCRMAQKPVVGCDVLASAVAMDKITTNTIMQVNYIPHARWFWYAREGIEQYYQEIDERITREWGGYPVFVKPSNGGSSVGISKAHDRAELVASIGKAAANDRRILIEEAITGREIELGVLAEETVFVSTVAAEIKAGHEFYDYEAKYLDSSSKTIVPADLPQSVFKEMQFLAEKAFRAIDGTSMARVDFFYDEAKGQVYLNEINTIPGFTEISMYPTLMKYSGISYAELVNRLIGWALRRKVS